MENFNIGNKKIGVNDPCLISFEPSSTYNNIEEAKRMIKATSLAGADAIKFQTFTTGDADRMMGKKDIMVKFSTPSGKKQEPVYEALKRRELSEEQWKELVEYSKELDLIFISSPYFPETVDFLEELGIDAIKVSKGDINNVLLIELIAKTGLPVILDGREKFVDVDRAVRICEANNNKKIVIMHCPSGYPAENSGVHLLAIKAIQEKYDYPVGFADHSLGDIMNYAAVSFGVKMLEITITLDKTTEHVEHFMSLELNELKKLVQNIRGIEEAMGDPAILNVSRVEESARRSFVAKKPIKKSQKITLDVLDFKRPGDAGISVSEGIAILKKQAARDIMQGTFITWNMLE